MKRKEMSFEGEPPLIRDNAESGMRISEAYLVSLKKRGLLTQAQIEQCKVKLKQIYADSRDE